VEIVAIGHLLDLVNDVTNAGPGARGVAGLQQHAVTGFTAQVTQRKGVNSQP